MIIRKYKTINKVIYYTNERAQGNLIPILSLHISCIASLEIFLDIIFSNYRFLFVYVLGVRENRLEHILKII